MRDSAGSRMRTCAFECRRFRGKLCGMGQGPARGPVNPPQSDRVAATGAENFSRAAHARPAHDPGRFEGYIGPDLTHFGSRTTLAAGVLKNTPDKSRSGSRIRAKSARREYAGAIIARAENGRAGRVPRESQVGSVRMLPNQNRYQSISRAISKAAEFWDGSRPSTTNASR